jgi:4-amino-4-deoxy-L-arabinose transferase-like glycosyltransferase
MHQNLLAILIFVIALGTYAATMPMSVTLEDAGLFQMVCYQGGLAHPPGYPLFTLACSALVVSPEIMNGNLVSALFGAFTVVVFFFLLLSITRSSVVAMIAALAYAFTATFWAQSIIIEVYSLAAFLLFLCWYALDRFARLKRQADWYLACLVFGLALSNHWPLAMLSAPALLAVIWPEIRSLLFKLTNSRFFY